MNYTLKHKQDEAAKAQEQARWRRELKGQVTHPKAEYTEARVARLMAQVDAQRRFWPVTEEQMRVTI